MPEAQRISIAEFFEKLLEYFGDKDWWPADSELEIIVGAILVQNTSWTNAEKAVFQLKTRGLMNPESLWSISLESLQEVIKPSGLYRQKSERIKAFITFLYDAYDGEFERLKMQSMDTLRAELLTIKGIGYETADCILLYALNYPIFVVDNYTNRIFSRIGFIEKELKYEKLQQFAISHLNEDVETYKNFHKLIIQFGKAFCRKRPQCRSCIMNTMCKFNVNQDNS